MNKRIFYSILLLLPFLFSLGGLLFFPDFINTWDHRVLEWILTIRNPSLSLLFRFLTSLGNASTVVILTCFVVGYFYYHKNYFHSSWFAITVIIPTVIINPLLKQIIHRPRPEEIYHLVSATSYSFPSGHSLGSVVVYGALAFLLMEHFPKEKKYSLGIWIFVGAFSFLIAMSRVYVGVHYLFDTIAGPSLGGFLLYQFIHLFYNNSIARKFKED